MNRRKFLQVSAFACTAPVINKINSIAAINVDTCLSPGAYHWEEQVYGQPFSRMVTDLGVFKFQRSKTLLPKDDL